MTLHYLFLSTGKLILPWNKWSFFVYKILYKFLSQNEILAPVSQITRMNSHKHNSLNYDIFPTPKQIQRALKPARWTHACTKGALIYHKNIVKKIFCGSELQTQGSSFSPPWFTKIPPLPDPVGSDGEQFSLANVVLPMSQEWLQEAHREDKKGLKEGLYAQKCGYQCLDTQQKISKIGNMTCTKNCFKKISSHRTVYSVVQELLQFKNHV